MRRLLAACTALFILGALADDAHAQPSPVDQQVAQTLFDTARQLMKEGKYAEACSRLEESQRLDPGGGTLLNLAICHEKLGRLATAHAEYAAALSQAIAAGRADRQRTARDALAALAPRLARLEITVDDPTPDLVVTVDSVALPRAAWGIATPFDPGRHVVRAQASGRRSHEVAVTLTEAQSAAVRIPALSPEPLPDAVAAAPPPLPPADAPTPRAELSCDGELALDGTCVQRPGPQRYVQREPPAIKQAMMITFITSVTTGLVVGSGALILRTTARCTPSEQRCDDQASLDRAKSARTLAWVSTVALGVGAASGLAYVLIPDRRVVVGATVAPGMAGLSVTIGAVPPTSLHASPAALLAASLRGAPP